MLCSQKQNIRFWRESSKPKGRAMPRKSFERNVVLERNLGGYYMRNFSHGLKFQPALRGEILLRLHGEFQPGFKHNFSIAAILFR